MQIKTIYGEMCNVYLIKSNKIIVVDAGASVEELKSQTSKVDYIFITHAHFDHIEYLLDYLVAYPNAKLLLTKRAYEKLDDGELNGASIFFKNKTYVKPSSDRVQFVDEGSKICDLDEENTFLILKGHTDCSAGLIINDCLFCGDAVFKDGFGRYDLPTGSFEETTRTLEKIKNLNVRKIYSGHGQPFDKV